MYTIEIKTKFSNETLLVIINRSLDPWEEVLVSGFRKLCVKENLKRRGRDPATDEGTMLEPRMVVVFRRSRQLKDKING